MSNQLLTDSVLSTTNLFDTSFELAVEQEILLADYDKSVFKIVKTCVDHTVTQKYINGNKLICEGYFRISVFYQPPGEDKLTVITKKQPFRHRADLTIPIQPPLFLSVCGRLQYVNTRAISSARISVSGIYSFNAKVYGQQKSDLITSVLSPTACTDSQSVTCFTLSGAGVRQFSMEDTLDLPENTEKILNIKLSGNSCNVIPYDDKVNVKGEATVDIFFTQEDSSEVRRKTKVFMYNQVVDLPGVTENNIAYGDFSIISFTVTANPDTNKTNCLIMAAIEVKAFRKENLTIARDCFSKSHEYTKSQKGISFDTNIISLSKSFNFQLEDTVGSGFAPVYTIVNISPPYTVQSEGKTVLQAKATVSVITCNQDEEYDCFTKTTDIIFDTDVVLQPQDEISVSCQPYSADAAIASDIMKVRFSVGISGFAIRRRKEKVLESFEENYSAPHINSADALVLYYGEKGEDVFDIAQRYRTDLSLIMEENNLESKILTGEKILLIPAYRQ